MYSSQYFEDLRANCKTIKEFIEEARQDIELEKWTIKNLPEELKFLYPMKVEHLRTLYKHQYNLKQLLKKRSRWLA